MNKKIFAVLAVVSGITAGALLHTQNVLADFNGKAYAGQFAESLTLMKMR